MKGKGKRLSCIVIPQHLQLQSGIRVSSRRSHQAACGVSTAEGHCSKIVNMLVECLYVIQKFSRESLEVPLGMLEGVVAIW